MKPKSTRTASSSAAASASAAASCYNMKNIADALNTIDRGIVSPATSNSSSTSTTTTSDTASAFDFSDMSRELQDVKAETDCADLLKRCRWIRLRQVSTDSKILKRRSILSKYSMIEKQLRQQNNRRAFTPVPPMIAEEIVAENDPVCCRLYVELF